MGWLPRHWLACNAETVDPHRALTWEKTSSLCQERSPLGPWLPWLQTPGASHWTKPSNESLISYETGSHTIEDTTYRLWFNLTEAIPIGLFSCRGSLADVIAVIFSRVGHASLLSSGSHSDSNQEELEIGLSQWTELFFFLLGKDLEDVRCKRLEY